ncbi:MAG: hypothetical protein V4611_00500 [Patescibacteria group bacterium]
MLQPNPDTLARPNLPPLELPPDYSQPRLFDQQFKYTHTAKNEPSPELVEKIGFKNRILRKVGAAALAITTALSMYIGDTNINIQKEKNAEISIEFIAPPIGELNKDMAILFFDGFNSSNASYLSKVLGPGLQEQVGGQIWATNFNNDIADRNEVLETVIELAKQRDVTHIIIVGYSKGGINATELAVDITNETWIDVDATVQMHTPSNYDGLQPYQQKELEAGMWISKIWRMRYFTGARFAGEVYFYHDKYTKEIVMSDNPFETAGNIFTTTAENIGNFFDVITQVSKRFQNPNLTSMSFLIEQVDEIDKANFPAEFEKIKNRDPTKQEFVDVYLGTKPPANDIVVDNVISGDAIGEAAEENDITFISEDVEDAKHSFYFNYIDQYNKAYANIAQELLRGIAENKANAQRERDELALRENH